MFDCQMDGEIENQMKPLSRKTNIVLALGLGLAVLIVLVLIARQLMGHLGETTASTARKLGEPIPVQISRIQRGEILEVLGAEGNLVESRSLAIQSELAGQIRQMPVQVGDAVDRGDLLIALDAAVAEAGLQAAREQVANAQAKLALNQKKLARLKALLGEGLITLDEIEKAEVDVVESQNALASFRAKLEQANHDRGATRILAPASGVITEVSVENGVAARPLSELLKLAVTEPIHFEFGVNQDKIAVARAGETVEVRLQAFPGQTFTAKVLQVKPVVDDKTQLATVQTVLDNPDGVFKPGMRGLATLTKRAQGIKVPAVSVMSKRDNVAQVFVVDPQGVARLREVKTGLQGGGYVEAISGLAEGEQVVVVGQAGLQDADKVRIGDEYAPR